MATILLSRRVPLRFDSIVSSLIRFNSSSPSRFFSDSVLKEPDARVLASEDLKRVLESKIRRVKIYPDRKDCPFKRVQDPDEQYGSVTLKGNIMGEKITIKGYGHLWEHYEEEDGEKDHETIAVYNSRIEDYTSHVGIEIDQGNGTYLEFSFEAYTGINVFNFLDTYLGCYPGSDKCPSDANENDIPGNKEPWMVSPEIEEDPEKWLASKGIECDISLANMVEEQMKNDRRHYLINWMKRLKDFTTT